MPCFRRPFAVAAVILVAACGDAPPDMPPEGATDAMEQNDAIPPAGTAEALGVANAREPRSGLVTAGQPTPEQIDALARAGYTRFISLRPSEEDGAGWEEEHLAGRDVAFERIPVNAPAGLTREAVEALDRALGDEPTVLYCGTSNRVGALLALRAHWLDGASPDEALEIGRAAGLTRLEPAVRQLLDGEGGSS